MKKHQDACERGMMEKSAVAEHAWENHHLIHWEETTVLDHGREQELLVKEALHNQMTPAEEHFDRDGGLGSPWFLDRCDEEAGREEQSSPMFDLQRCISSNAWLYNSNVCSHLFTFALMMTGAFS